MTPLQALEMIYDDCEMDSGLMIKSGNSFEDLEKAFEVIRTALTPPTADEVCEAICKIENTIVRYDSNLKAFIDQDEFTLIVMMDSGLLLRLYDTYPPNTLSLISRFYEAQE